MSKEGFTGVKAEQMNTTSKVVDPQEEAFRALYGKRTITISVVGQEELIDNIIRNLAEKGAGHWSFSANVRALLGTYYGLSGMDAMAIFKFAESMKDEFRGVKLMLIAAIVFARQTKEAKDHYGSGKDLDKLIALSGTTLRVVRDAVNLFKSLPEFEPNHPVYTELKKILSEINDIEIIISDTTSDRQIIRKLEQANLDVDTEKQRMIDEIKREAELAIDEVKREAEAVKTANSKSIVQIDGFITRAMHARTHGDACACEPCRVARAKNEANAEAAKDLRQLRERMSRLKDAAGKCAHACDKAEGMQWGDPFGGDSLESCSCSCGRNDEMGLGGPFGESSELNAQLKELLLTAYDDDLIKILEATIATAPNAVKKTIIEVMKLPDGEACVIETFKDMPQEIQSDLASGRDGSKQRAAKKIMDTFGGPITIDLDIERVMKRSLREEAQKITFPGGIGEILIDKLPIRMSPGSIPTIIGGLRKDMDANLKGVLGKMLSRVLGPNIEIEFIS